MQIHGAVPQEAFAGELPQGVTCVGIPTSVGVLTGAFIDEAVAGIAPEAESALRYTRCLTLVSSPSLFRRF